MKSKEILIKLIEIDRLFHHEADKGKAESARISEKKSFQEIGQQKLEGLLSDITNIPNLAADKKQEAKALILQIVQSQDLSLEDTLALYTKIAYLFEENGNAAEHAFKLGTLFKTKDDIFNYLIAFSLTNPQADLMHDACGFVLPQGTTKDIEKWKTLATTQPKGEMYPLLKTDFKKLLGLSNEIVAFVNEKTTKKQSQETREKLIADIQTQQGVFAPTSVFQITGKGNRQKLEQSKISIDVPVANTKHETLLKMGQAHLEKLIAAYTKLCDQYEHNKQTTGQLIGDENYLHALAKRQELRAKRSEFYLGQPFKQLSIPQLLDYYEAYLKQYPDPIRSHFASLGISEQKYKQFLSLNTKQGGIHIPDLLIDGASIGCPGYYLKKMNVNNENEAAIVATLGKKTDCCQSLSGEAGEPCVIHSLTNPDGGCYAIFKGDIEQAKKHSPTLKELDESFQGGMWVWRSKNNALVFDSVEMLSPGGHTPYALEEIGIALVRKTANELFEKHGIETVSCGSSSGISEKVGIVSIYKPEQFKKDYTDYTDAKKQLILIDKHRPFYFYGIDQKSTDAAVQWFQDALNVEAEAILHSIPFWEAINWILVHREHVNWILVHREHGNILQIIREIAEKKSPQHLSTVNHVINKLQSYIREGLSDEIIDEIEKNVFFLEALDENAHTPLQLACIQQNTKFALFLIQANVDLDYRDSKGYTAIIFAMKEGLIDVVKRLINAKAKLENEDRDGNTTLLLAVQAGSLEVVKALIEAKANLEHKNDDGDTPLILAVKAGDIEIVKALLAAKINLEHSNEEGNTALMLAAEGGKTEILKALIAAKANLEHKNKRGNTAVLLAAQAGKTEILKILIKEKAALESTNNDDLTALMLAAREGQTEIVQTLIEEKVDLDKTTKTGSSALMFARKTDTALALIHAKANLNSKTEHGYTALGLAITANNTELTLALLEAKACPDEPKADPYSLERGGHTLLMHAIKNKNTEIALALINSKVNLDEMDNQEHTALYWAIKLKQTKIALALIQAGANLDAINGYGTKARPFALARGETAIVEAIDQRLKVLALEADQRSPTAILSTAPVTIHTPTQTIDGATKNTPKLS